ncbi:MAG: hypothetical protein Q9225_006429 [Loekoesia sp. 1 TL-2023]
MDIPPGVDPNTTPAGQHPPGVLPNFTDPPTLTTPTVVVSTLMIVLASIFVLVRLCAIAFVGRRMAWDDFTNVARHMWDLPLSAFMAPSYARLIFAQNILQAPAVAFAKSSILLLYLRIFTVKASMRYAIYGGLIFTNVLYWIHIPLVAGFCAPRGKYPILDWDNCAKLTVWGPVQGFLALVLDIYIFLLPFPVISQLHLAPRKKLGVCFLFGTAVFGIVASTLAEVYRFELWFHVADLNWRQAQLFICIIVEGYIAIIVGSMPALASFFKSSTAGESDTFARIRSRIATKFFHPSQPSDSSGKKSATSSSGHTKRSYPRTDSETESNTYLRTDSYIELGDTPRTNAYSNGPNRDIEEGVIKKSVAIKQSQQTF